MDGDHTLRVPSLRRHSGRWPAATLSPPPAATSHFKSKRLRFLVEPGSVHRTTIHLEGFAQLCTCISRPGLSATPSSYWVTIRHGDVRTSIQCPAGRPVQVGVPKDRSFDLTIEPCEGAFAPYYVEAVLLYL